MTPGAAQRQEGETDTTRYAIRVEGRGVVTTVNDAPIIGREAADRAAKFIREALLEDCAIARLLLSVPEEAPR